MRCSSWSTQPWQRSARQPRSISYERLRWFRSRTITTGSATKTTPSLAIRGTRATSATLCMLRGHTSAGIPSALRRIAAKSAADDVLVALPGICHRRDAIDRLHTGSPHQLDLWRLQRDKRRLEPDDLAQMVDTVFDGNAARENMAVDAGAASVHAPGPSDRRHRRQSADRGRRMRSGRSRRSFRRRSGLQAMEWAGARHRPGPGPHAPQGNPRHPPPSLDGPEGHCSKCSTCRRIGQSRTYRRLGATCLSR